MHPRDPMPQYAADYSRTVLREVRAVTKHRDPGGATWKGVRIALLQAASALRHASGQSPPPVDLSPLLGLRRISRVEDDLSGGGTEASLIPVSTGFVIRVAASQSRARQRASIAHELGHTFFYDLTASPPARLLPPVVLVGKQHFKEEDVCWAFARELLVPRELITSDLESPGLYSGLSLLRMLAARYDVSSEFVCVRILHDIGFLRRSIAVFADRGSSRPREGVRLRRYFGKDAAHGLLKEQRRVLELMEQALAAGSPVDVLERLADTARGIADIDYSVSSERDYNTAAMLITYAPSGAR